MHLCHAIHQLKITDINYLRTYCTQNGMLHTRGTVHVKSLGYQFFDHTFDLAFRGTLFHHNNHGLLLLF